MGLHTPHQEKKQRLSSISERGSSPLNHTGVSRSARAELITGTIGANTNGRDCNVGRWIVNVTAWGNQSTIN